jgi:phage shock protein C
MESKRLFRSRTDVMLGGVCGGLAKYLNVDPTVIRLVFVLLLFIGGGGFWIYLVLWFITPVEPSSSLAAVVEVKAKEVEVTPSSVKTDHGMNAQDSLPTLPVVKNVATRVTKKSNTSAKPRTGTTGTPTIKTDK